MIESVWNSVLSLHRQSIWWLDLWGLNLWEYREIDFEEVKKVFL